MKTMRVWMNAEELERTLDCLMDRQIRVVRKDENGREYDVKRNATSAEKKLLRGIFAGAIGAMNWGEEIRSDDHQAHAIIECAEFTVLNLWNDKKGDRIQSYLSVYNPLCKVLRDWKRETVY